MFLYSPIFPRMTSTRFALNILEMCRACMDLVLRKRAPSNWGKEEFALTGISVQEELSAANDFPIFRKASSRM